MQQNKSFFSKRCLLAAPIKFLLINRSDCGICGCSPLVIDQFRVFGFENFCKLLAHMFKNINETLQRTLDLDVILSELSSNQSLKKTSRATF